MCFFYVLCLCLSFVCISFSLLPEKGLTSCLSLVMFTCAFVTFSCGILGQVWYLIVSIPDLCHIIYFEISWEADNSQKVLICSLYYVVEAKLWKYCLLRNIGDTLWFNAHGYLPVKPYICIGSCLGKRTFAVNEIIRTNTKIMQKY